MADYIGRLISNGYLKNVRPDKGILIELKYRKVLYEIRSLLRLLNLGNAGRKAVAPAVRLSLSSQRNTRLFSHIRLS